MPPAPAKRPRKVLFGGLFNCEARMKTTHDLDLKKLLLKLGVGKIELVR